MKMITIHNLHKTYNTGVTALDHISLELPSTGFVFINGKSGSGKTTLLNLLAGLILPSSGEIFYENRNLLDFNAKEWSDYRNTTIGVVFQTFNLIDDLTVADNLKLPLLIQDLAEDEREAKVDEILAYIELQKYKDYKVSELSAGQKQRIAIARAVIKRPKVIFADEATGNLDYVNSQYVLGLFNKISHNCLVVLISHDRSSAEKYADRIITLSDGRIVSDINNQKVKNLSTTPYQVTIGQGERELKFPLWEFDLRELLQKIGTWKDGYMAKCEFITTITRQDDTAQEEKRFQCTSTVPTVKRLEYRHLKQLISRTLKKKGSKNYLIICICAFLTLLLLIAQLVMWNDYSSSMLSYVHSHKEKCYKMKQEITTKKREFELEKGRNFYSDLATAIPEKQILKVNEDETLTNGDNDCTVDCIIFQKDFFRNHVEGKFPKKATDIILHSKVADKMKIQIGDWVYVDDRKYTVTGLFDQSFEDNNNLISTTKAAASRGIDKEGFVNMQACDITKSACLSEYVSGIQTIGPTSQIHANELIHGRMPKKDNEFLISSDLADDLGYFDKGVIFTDYRLRNIYDKKYEGEYSEYYNLFDALGKNVKIVGIYKVEKNGPEVANISLTTKKYKQILSAYEKYFGYSSIYVDMAPATAKNMEQLLDKSIYPDNDTCRFIFQGRKLLLHFRGALTGASLVFLLAILCAIIAFMSYHVKEAGKQIGILKSIGICDKDLGLLFILHNMFLNTIAVVLAALFSFLVITAMNVRIAAASSFRSVHILVFDLPVVLLVCATVLLITLIATVLPMKKLLRSESLLLINENDI